MCPASSHIEWHPDAGCAAASAAVTPSSAWVSDGPCQQGPCHTIFIRFVIASDSVICLTIEWLLMSETENVKAETGEPEYPLPPVSFEFLMLSLKTQAEMQLGLLHFGEESERPAADLRLARHTIDLMSMLQEKTRGNLTLEEQRLLDNSLTELRFRFVQAVEAANKKS